MKRSLPQKLSSLDPLRSTRSDENEDARRDFDGFDPDEELLRFREAADEGRNKLATELAHNLDEWMSRGGVPPMDWRRKTFVVKFKKRKRA